MRITGNGETSSGTILKYDIDIGLIVKIGIKFTNIGVLKFRVDLNLPLELFVEIGIIDILFEDNLDGHFFFRIFLNGSVDYARPSSANLFLDGEAVDIEVLRFY